MTALEAMGRGFATRVGSVPIVVGLSLFDLAVGDPTVRPGPAEGRQAFEAATTDGHEVGLVGAGTGATVAKWSGRPRPGGLGTATRRAGAVTVSALVAVNAYGFIDDGTSVADPGPPWRPDPEADDDTGPVDPAGTNTTIGVVATDAALDKTGCHLLAQSAHDGLARSLLPAHTAADGDAFVALATGRHEIDPVELTHLRALTQAVVAAAVRSVGDGPSGPGSP